MEAVLETALRHDALTITPDGFELRVGLPWIRSMPLSSVSALGVEVDGVPVAPDDLAVLLGDRKVSAAALPNERGWWFIQDRLVLAGTRGLHRGVHAVSASFQLLVPYLQARPGSPLVLPFHLQAQLDTAVALTPGASSDVA
jgi:hypothetical protein